MNRIDDIALYPDRFQAERDMMVKTTIQARGIDDPVLLEAFRKVPREAFVPADLESYAYDDRPLQIGQGQTISQPYIVALMASLAKLQPGDRILEVGSGSGYASAVFSCIVDHVDGIERHEHLVIRSRSCLDKLGYDRVDIHLGDGAKGLPGKSPFNAIIVSAGGPGVPDPLVDQLAVGGRLVIPVGDENLQYLERVTRISSNEFLRETFDPVKFVPLIGEGAWNE